MPFSTRCMEREDVIPAIQILKGLSSVAFADWETEKLVIRAIETNPDVNWVAYDDNRRIVGATIGGYFDKRGTITHAGVEPRFQGNGIGEALCHRSISALFKHRVELVHVHVLDGNEKALTFFRQNFPFSYSNTRVFMELDVEDAGFARADLIRLTPMDLPLVSKEYSISFLDDDPQIGDASFVEERDNGYRGIIIAGSAGVRGVIRNLRINEGLDHLTRKVIGAALLRRSLAEFAKMGVKRVHAFPKRTNEFKIQLLTMAGFRTTTDHYLELQRSAWTM